MPAMDERSPKQVPGPGGAEWWRDRPPSVWRSMTVLVGVPLVVGLGAGAWLWWSGLPSGQIGGVAVAASSVIAALAMIAVREGARVVAAALTGRELVVQWLAEGLLLAGTVALYALDYRVAGHVVLGLLTVMRAVSAVAVRTPEHARRLLEASGRGGGPPSPGA